jgi:hypothetical protein
MVPAGCRSMKFVCPPSLSVPQVRSAPFIARLLRCVLPISRGAILPGPVHTPPSSLRPPNLARCNSSQPHPYSAFLSASSQSRAVQFLPAPSILRPPLCVLPISRGAMLPSPIHTPPSSLRPPNLARCNSSRPHPYSAFLSASSQSRAVFPGTLTVFPGGVSGDTQVSAEGNVSGG